MMIALVDCDNFYCSCEQVFRPDLKDRPVVVLSNNDGCVIARNTLAKKCDIPMGAAYYRYRTMMKRYNVEVFSSNFPLYANFSSRVMAILKKFSPCVEVYSIDEAFIQLSDVDTDFITYCKQIRSEVMNGTGISISIGIAPSKVLTKVASKLAKKNPLLEGVCYLKNEEHINKNLRVMDVSDIWGIGDKQTQKCHHLNIVTAYDFKVYKNRALLQSIFTKLGCQIQDELKGMSCLELTDVVQKRKQIRVSRSFKKEIVELDDIGSAMSFFVTRAMEKCRRQGTVCQVVTIFVSTSAFCKEKVYRQSLSTGLLNATNDTVEIIKLSKKMLEKIFKKGYSYKKAGVILSGFSDDDCQQLSFYKVKELDHLMKTIDTINQKHGRDTVFLASQKRYLDKGLQQSHLSRQYTTNWDHILQVS